MNSGGTLPVKVAALSTDISGSRAGRSALFEHRAPPKQQAISLAFGGGVATSPMNVRSYFRTEHFAYRVDDGPGSMAAAES